MARSRPSRRLDIMPPYRAIALRNSILVASLVGGTTGILSGVFSDGFGLPNNPTQTVVQFPTIVNAIGFACISAGFCFLASAIFWMYPTYRRVHVLVLSSIACVMLVALWTWMVLYPQRAVLATQIFTLPFLMLSLLFMGCAWSFGYVIAIIAAFTLGWLNVLVFVTYQNTITADFFSQNVRFGASVQIDGSMYLSGRSPVSANNVTQDIANPDFVVVSAPYFTTLAETAQQHVTILDGVTIMNATNANVFLLNVAGMWSQGTLATPFTFVSQYLFQETQTAMANATREDIFFPDVAFTLPATECIRVDAFGVDENVFLSGYKFRDDLPATLSVVLTIQDNSVRYTVCNLDPVDSILIPEGVLTTQVTFLTWIRYTTTQLICQLLQCAIWCFTTQSNNYCTENGCCT